MISVSPAWPNWPKHTRSSSAHSAPNGDPARGTASADGRSRRRRSALLLLERFEQHLAGLAGFGLVSRELELADRLARRRTDRPVGGAAVKAEIAQENLNGLGLVRSVGGPGADVDRALGLLLLGPFRRPGRRVALARLPLRRPRRRS